MNIKVTAFTVREKSNNQDFSYECVTETLFSYFSTKTYAVGTQKNRLNETILLSTENIC